MHNARSVLVVDDDPDFRGFVRVLLEQEGCEVREAEDGREALALLREELPDLVLLDLVMPVMDGRALLSAIRDDDRLSRVPVAVLAASGRTRAPESVVALDKPLDLPNLLSLLALIDAPASARLRAG
jgi:CheY-like chemotaxis protein